MLDKKLGYPYKKKRRCEITDFVEIILQTRTNVIAWLDPSFICPFFVALSLSVTVDFSMF